ncbi:MAG: type II toxin-antitoxin system VapB family antitoxin [Alphaproteobacteria bacterium]|nr:type II toxin-antitoxin system VapB family antitoxin [Alphaproteobacteria bacterium]
MGLNIKSEETCRLARELAQLTGEAKTGAITVALRERLERERHRRGADILARELRAIG